MVNQIVQQPFHSFLFAGLEELITLLPVTEDQLVNELQRNNTHLYLSDEPGLKVQEALNEGKSVKCGANFKTKCSFCCCTLMTLCVTVNECPYIRCSSCYHVHPNKHHHRVWESAACCLWWRRCPLLWWVRARVQEWWTTRILEEWEAKCRNSNERGMKDRW